jgi:serine/threonine protein kinase
VCLCNCLVGTPEYLAPEILLNRGHNLSVDFWSLGILIYECLAGYPPFVDDSPMIIYQKILSGNIHYPNHFSSTVCDLISKLLINDPSLRLGSKPGLGISELKGHAWFKTFDWIALYNYELKAPITPNPKQIQDLSTFEVYEEDETLPQHINPKLDPFVNF